MSNHGARTAARLGAALAGAMLVARGQSVRCEIGATSKTSISPVSGGAVCRPTGVPGSNTGHEFGDGAGELVEVHVGPDRVLDAKESDLVHEDSCSVLRCLTTAETIDPVIKIRCGAAESRSPPQHAAHSRAPKTTAARSRRAAGLID